MDTTTLNRLDPLQRQPECGAAADHLSPMDPPEAYAPPAVDQVAPEAMHPYLRTFSAEHAVFMVALTTFEEAVLSIQQDGFTVSQDRALRHFFHVFEQEFIPHSRREDATLFPVLHQRLLADGEHSPGEVPTTAVDLMEDDHLKIVQLAAVILNLLGLVFRLPDAPSRLIVLDAALEQGKNLVELMRLHIFREDNIVFPSAHRLISPTEFDRMQTSGAQDTVP